MADCMPFCLGKGGAGGGESILSGAGRTYPTVFSRLRDCSGEGKGGEGCTFWPQGTAYSPMLFSRCGPLVSRGGRQSAGCFPLVGGKWQEQFSPCLAPPALLEAILPAIQRVGRWGEIPLSRGLPCASRCPPAPSFWGGVFAAAAPCPLRPERCGRGKAPAVCGAVCGLLPPALGGGPRPFEGGFAAIFQADSPADPGGNFFQGEGFGGRMKRKDRSAASRPNPRRWGQKNGPRPVGGGAVGAI